jgi:hypothetical protein
MTPNPFIDSGAAFDENSDGLVIQTYQAIPQEFTDALKQERFENSQSRVKNEYHRVASIPVVVVDKWIREGFDFYQASAKEILARLKTEHLDAFITSDKA